jgi:hypothetical protein
LKSLDTPPGHAAWSGKLPTLISSSKAADDVRVIIKGLHIDGVSWSGLPALRAPAATVVVGDGMFN